MHTIGEYMAAQAKTRLAAGDVFFSPPEVYLAMALQKHGLEFVQQARVGGRVLDFLVEGQLCVEVDGKAFHNPRDDYIRDQELRDHHIYTLRIPAWKVMRDEDGALSMVANKLFEIRNLCKAKP